MSSYTPAQSVTSQGQYAVALPRFLAYALALGVSTGVFVLALAGIAFAVQIVTGKQVSWDRQDIAVAVTFVAWQFLYFGYSWAMNGKSAGMAVLGVRVVRADGLAIDPWRGWLRSLVFPLSFLLFGLGFLGILVQRERRALHDLIAGTAVVYSWDARGARLRFLAREAELAASPLAGDAGTAAER